MVDRDRVQDLGDQLTQNRRSLFRLAFRLTGNEHDAEDAVQEAMAQAMIGYRSFRGDASISTWLYRITVRIATRIRARRPVTSSAPIDISHTESPDGVMNTKEQTERLFAAMDRLPWAQRVALSLSALEDLDRHQIAGIMGVPVGTVDSRLHHAREKLKDILSKWGLP